MENLEFDEIKEHIEKTLALSLNPNTDVHPLQQASTANYKFLLRPTHNEAKSIEEIKKDNKYIIALTFPQKDYHQLHRSVTSFYKWQETFEPEHLDESKFDSTKRLFLIVAVIFD